MNVFDNRMVNLHKFAGTIPAMMSALERTAVSVTSDGRTERGPFFHQNLGLVHPFCTNYASDGGAFDSATKRTSFSE